MNKVLFTALLTLAGAVHAAEFDHACQNSSMFVYAQAHAPGFGKTTYNFGLLNDNQSLNAFSSPCS